MNKLPKEAQARREPRMFHPASGKGRTVDEVVKDRRGIVMRFLESIPDAEADHAHVVACAREKGGLHPARLQVSGWDYRKVRKAKAEGETKPAVRVEIPFEGDSAAFDWILPSLPEGLAADWSLSEDQKRLWVFQEVGEDEEARGEASDSAVAAGETILSMMRVLGLMRETAEAWNASIPEMVEQHFLRRRQEEERRKAFMEGFRRRVEAVLLAPPQEGAAPPQEGAAPPQEGVAPPEGPGGGEEDGLVREAREQEN